MEMIRNSQESDLLNKHSSLKNQKLNHKERLKLLKQSNINGDILSIADDDRIFLRKNNTREDICLGKILIGENNLLYYKFEDERNIFIKTQAWSINYRIFEQVDLIHYETLKYNYTIPKVRAEEFGEIFDFQNEKKIYIPIIYWDKRRNLIDPTELRRRNLFGDSWYELLKDTINSEYMSKIGNWIRQRRTEILIYPEERNVFRALKLCSFKQTKVVIIGQDPYHDGSANGLAFGYNKWRRDQYKGVTTKKTPKSLDIILKEVERDIYKGFHLDFDESLESWAEQGVLLLNTILTVEKGQSKSHENLGWQRFIKIILYEMIKDQDNPKVFLLWGNDAQNLMQEVIDKSESSIGFSWASHEILKSKHPASDLYNADQFGNIAPSYPNTFAGNAHFSQTNQFLVKNKRKPIIW